MIVSRVMSSGAGKNAREQDATNRNYNKNL
jgi:hypothetical protein